jgi:predicted ATPase
MTINDNPYATALDGLILDDPVRAFFDFCRERENIRRLRESGAPAPWSEDPIFQQGRFLNIFREDDRGTKALFRFVEPVSESLENLVQAIFFARWCNRQSTLDTLSAPMLLNPVQLGKRLEALPIQPWSNVAAYPVEPVRWEGKLYSRFDAATSLFGQIKSKLTQLIVDAQGDVIRATRAINQHFGMSNDFPIFMAVMDVAWFRPDIIDPASHVPTGIGAVAFLDRLQRHLELGSHEATCDRMIELQLEYWPEAKRRLQPIDIEYLSCECRKYYSYVNGTKTFDGKNRFHPGQSAQLYFDVSTKHNSNESDRFDTQLHIIAGGPCSGKTTLLNALRKEGHRVEVETAERLLEEGIKAGHTSEALRSEPLKWQQEVLQQDYELFEGLPTNELIFTDTSFIEDLVFAERAGIKMGPNIVSWLQTKRYKTVFFLDPIDTYQQSEVRIESQQVALQISDMVRKRYRQCGYQLVCVPAVSVAERLAFINSHIDSTASPNR